MAKALAKIQDLNLILFPIGSRQTPTASDQPLIDSLLWENKLGQWGRRTPTVKIWHEHDMVEFPTNVRVGFPVWELDRISDKASRLLDLCDLVLVPSQWQRSIYRTQAGLNSPPVEVVREGVDTSVFKPIPELRPQRGVACVHIGKAEDRKGTLEIAQAFLEAFQGHPEYTLRMYIGNPFLGAETRRAWSERLPKHRTITYDWSMLSTSEHVASILNRHHIFIGASKAEGWNLPQIEALACGLHVVATDNTGMGEYMSPAVAHVVPSGPLVTAKDGIFFSGQGMWHQVLVDSLVQPLRDAAKKASARQVNKSAVEHAQDFTWDHAANQLIKALEAHKLL